MAKTMRLKPGHQIDVDGVIMYYNPASKPGKVKLFTEDEWITWQNRR
jgi:hypothetical protein